jgi:hypothetical protein
MSDRIGLDVVPDFTDAELLGFLQKTIFHDTQYCEEVLADLIGTTDETKEKGQSEEFAYAKLMNYITDLPKPVRIHLCAAALWKLHGQNNAEIHALPQETDTD